MRILYIDPIFGISGDMMISALISAGLPFRHIDAILKRIPLHLPAIKAVETRQNVIEGIHLDIEEVDVHLSVADMESIIRGLDISDIIKRHALEMLEIILKAEAKIHGTTREEVHLHELSHVDTLIDLLSVAAGIEYFEIDKVYCGAVPCGRGVIRTAHGIIPNPPPVTLEILSGYPLAFFNEALELTTPTGAAIVRHYAQRDRMVPPFTAEKTGYGIGSYKCERPDVLRIFIGSSCSDNNEEEVWMLECDIDDMEMEYVGAVADRIRDTGALDVLYFPVFMKKGRPGIRLSVMSPIDKLNEIVAVVFQETTTFGMRIRKEARKVLKRNEMIVETSYGPVRVKQGYDHTGVFLKNHVEFEDVKRIADANALPYRTVLNVIQAEIASMK